MSWEVINFSLSSLCPCLPPSLSPYLSSGSLARSFHYFQLLILSHSATSLAQRPFLHFNSELITALIETVIALIALINHLFCGKAFVGICNCCWHWLFVECCWRARINIFSKKGTKKKGGFKHTELSLIGKIYAHGSVWFTESWTTAVTLSRECCTHISLHTSLCVCKTGCHSFFVVCSLFSLQWLYFN